MPEDDDSTRERPRDYHRKSDIEKYIAEPLLALAQAIERYVNEVTAERVSQTKDEQSRNDAEERRHRENIGEEKRATKWAARISGATLLVLLATLYVYNRQATIMATQASIMDKQREISDKQAADLKRQIEDAEAVERASVVIQNFRIEGFPEHPVMKFTLKNVGQTTATEITAGMHPYSSGWFKNMKKPYGNGVYGPGERETYSWLAKAFPPSKAGFSLAQGETRDFAWPMEDVEREMNESPIARKVMGISPTFEDVAKGRASFYREIVFTYLDASGKAHPTVDCLTYAEHQFVPCWGGHAEE